MTAAQSEFPPLSATELEQATIINRLNLPLLQHLLGVVETTSTPTQLVLFTELLAHTQEISSLNGHLESLGSQRMNQLLAITQDLICKKWGYCKRRKAGGFGDPRELIGSIARLIAPALKTTAGRSVSRSELIISSVALARSNLGQLCRCRHSITTSEEENESQRPAHGRNHRPPNTSDPHHRRY